MAGFNSKEYDWSHIEIAFQGKLMTRATAVSYEESIDAKPMHAKGFKAFDIGDGNHSLSGSIEMFQSEYSTLLLLTGNKGITPMKGLILTVAFSNEDRPLETRSLIGVRVTKGGEGVKQGDGEIKVTLEFIATDIKFL